MLLLPCSDRYFADDCLASRWSQFASQAHGKWEWYCLVILLFCIFLHVNINCSEHSYEAITDVLMEILVKATTAPPQTANLLTIVRAITNLFKHSCFSNWLQSHYSEVLPSCFTILVLNCFFFSLNWFVVAFE